MFKRVAKYIKTIKIEGGPVWYRLNKQTYHFEPNPSQEFTYNILGSTLQPGQDISVTTGGRIVIETIERDGDEFFDLGLSLSTDLLHYVVVRGFYPQPVTNLDKHKYIEGFVYADLVF